MSRIIVTKPLDVILTCGCEIDDYENVKNYINSLHIVKEMRFKKPNDETKKLHVMIFNIRYFLTIEFWNLSGKYVVGVFIGSPPIEEDCLAIDGFYKKLYIIAGYTEEPYYTMDSYLSREEYSLADEICDNLINHSELAKCYNKRDSKINYIEFRYGNKKYQARYNYIKIENINALHIRLYSNTTIDRLKSLDTEEETKPVVSRLVKYAEHVEKLKLTLSKLQI